MITKTSGIALLAASFDFCHAKAAEKPRHVHRQLNDGVCSAISINVGDSASFNNTLASAENGEVNPGDGTGSDSALAQDGWYDQDPVVQNSLWYTIIGPASGCVNIFTESDDRDTRH
jgi:hypothetical protein